MIFSREVDCRRRLPDCRI
ncbi:hypothetical protein LINPERHAP1_LOCUS23269 [Linum perenne]